MDHLSDRCWSEATGILLDLAGTDLDRGLRPVPTLIAFDGDRAVAIVGLRPFDRDDAVQALIEVLSLLLPLGVDRLALSLPGLAWSLDDPIVPVSDEVDLRSPVLVIIVADGHDHPCRSAVELHPYQVTDDGHRWDPPVRPDQHPTSAIDHALEVLLDDRDALHADDDLRMAAQLGRVLLLGHEVVLAPAAARRLELASTT